MYEVIDSYFDEKNIKSKEQGVYVGYDNEEEEVSGDLFSFLVIIELLAETDWFKNNVGIWNWYEDDEVEDLVIKFEI